MGEGGGDLGKQKLFDPSPSQTHFFPNCEKTETNKQVIQSKESECNPHSMSDKICITTSFGILKYFQVSIWYNTLLSTTASYTGIYPEQYDIFVID